MFHVCCFQRQILNIRRIEQIQLLQSSTSSVDRIGENRPRAAQIKRPSITIRCPDISAKESKVHTLTWSQTLRNKEDSRGIIFRHSPCRDKWTSIYVSRVVLNIIIEVYYPLNYNFIDL